jgi:hypothetical protein
MTLSAALLVALLFQSPADVSGAGPTRLQLAVHAAPECTSRRDLATRIAERSPRIEVVDEAPVSAEVTVTSRRPGKVAADLVLGVGGAVQPARRVMARTCPEVADGVALIIAVTLDPSLRRGPPAAADERGVAPSEAPGPAGSGGATAASGEQKPAPLSPPAPKPADHPPAPPAPPEGTATRSPPPPDVAPPMPRRHEFGAYLAGQTVLGPAPAIMPGIAVYAMAALERQGPWSPALVFGATRVWRADLSETGGTASFTLDAVSLDACPLQLRWTGLTARPCASALLGRLTTRGSNATPALSATRPFAVAGAVIGAGFGSKVEVSARLAVGLTLIRDSYEFGTAVFHRADPITVSASVGLGAHWR